MTTSLITFENKIRERLLDVVYRQWHEFGVPFSLSHQPESVEIIDPEALLWCSLEFLPTEPRLWEGVQSWLQTHDGYIIQQRIKRVSKAPDPRTCLWRTLFKLNRSEPESPTEPCYGLDSIEYFTNFCKKIEWPRRKNKEQANRTGKPLAQPSTILLHARNLLGNDLRHILLVYLLANRAGSRLKDIEYYSKYSYRSLSETATRWAAAGVLTIEHGYCHLVDPEPWHALLQIPLRNAVIVDWFGIFEALIHLLRACAKIRRKGLLPDNPIINFCSREAEKALSSAALSEDRVEPSSIAYLRKPLAGLSGL